MAAFRMRLASLAIGTCVAVSREEAAIEASCPGKFAFQGLGNVSLIPTGWVEGPSDEEVTFAELDGNGSIKSPMGSRSYFASTCTAGKYDNEQYLALDLRGKTLIYTTDLSLAGCGCNAALYLTSMRQNKRPSECGDHYCDANNVCGESCDEIDIQEGNVFSWHSTLHSSWDHVGMGKGYGGGGFEWNGPRDWTSDDYGPLANCIDTTKSFQVSAYFPTDDKGRATGMEITLTQHGKDCPLWVRVSGYRDMDSLDKALAAGMTPIVSYWRSEEMLWMDGKGKDYMGPCLKDTPDRCGDSVSFYDFAVRPSFPTTTAAPPAPVPSTTVREARKAGQGRRHPAVVQAFLAGAFTLMGTQLVCILAVWGVRAAVARGGQSPCPNFPCPGAPLKRVPTSSSQNLLMLAEGGGLAASGGAEPVSLASEAHPEVIDSR